MEGIIQSPTAQLNMPFLKVLAVTEASGKSGPHLLIVMVGAWGWGYSTLTLIP